MDNGKCSTLNSISEFRKEILDVISDEVMYIKQLPDKLEVPNLHYNYKMRRNGYKSQFPQLDLINIRRHIVPATRRYNSRRLQSLAFKLQVKDIFQIIIFLKRLYLVYYSFWNIVLFLMCD